MLTGPPSDLAEPPLSRPRAAEPVVFFDTTLRDGEQAPGSSLSPDKKVQIAHQLARLGVDVVEAGFPASSAGDFEAVRRIAGEVPGPVISGLARCVEGDVLSCWEAVREAERPRVHVFLSTSDIHLQHQMRIPREEALRLIRRMVALAATLCPNDVQFSAMDATRTAPAFLAAAFSAAIDSGATTVNISDTVGYALPHEYTALVRSLNEAIPALGSSGGVALSVHCHDDLGLATANSLAAIAAGVSQVEVAVNGLGERAGVAALEEVAMALVTRGEALGRTCNIVTAEIARSSRLVSSLTGQVVQANKAVVGKNAFAHESGIHQDGMLKERSTYEIMRAEDVGLDGSTIVLGKHSGRRALNSVLEGMGVRLGRGHLDEVFAAFKHRTDKGEELDSTDLRELADGLVTIQEETPGVSAIVG